MRLAVIISTLLLSILPTGAAETKAVSDRCDGNGLRTMQAQSAPFELKANGSRLLDGNTRINGIERPSWIPGWAYTNANMIVYYGRKIWRLEITRKLPDSPTTAVLAEEIGQYWSGQRPRPCKLRIEPMANAPPGSFSFHTIGHPNGPQGWLQATGEKDEIGWQYRYWFDEPQAL